MKVKAVLFDIGNTLVYSRPEETFQEILLAHGIREPIGRVKQALTKGNKEFDIDKHIHLSAHEFYTEWNLVHLRLLCIQPADSRKLAEENRFRVVSLCAVARFSRCEKNVEEVEEKATETRNRYGRLRRGHKEYTSES